MSGTWKAGELDISPDPYVDWAAGPAFAELDVETGGACRYIVVHDKGCSFASLDELRALVDGGSTINDLAGPLPPDSIGKGKAKKAEPSDDGDDDALRVIVGVIDDGIAIANERFRKPDGEGRPLRTRFERFWLQDGVAGDRFPAAGYGREFSRNEIDTLMADHVHGGGIDEDGLYRTAGICDMGRAVTSSTSMRMSHGSHVLDVAAGFSPFVESQDARRQALIAVQLPRRVTRDTSGKFAYVFIIDAVNYIVAEAEAVMTRIGRRLPIVINLSYGVAAGPHDGSLDICSRIDDIVRDFNAVHADAPLAVILPSGNGHLSRQHATEELARGKSKTFRVCVLPDDLTSSFIELWLPEPGSTGDAVYSVSVAPSGHAPASPALTSAAPGYCVQWEDGGAVRARISYMQNEEGRGWFHIAWQASTAFGEAAPTAPSGSWLVTVSQKGGKAGKVDAWIQRDDSPFGFRQRGRQAYFDDPDYEVYHPTTGRLLEVDNDISYCRRSGTLSAFACGQEPLIIGAVMAAELKPAPYTAAGAAPRIPNPDAAAVADDSKVHFGVLSAGTRSGSAVAMNGTSVAAPQITRRLAAAMAAGRIDATNTPRQWLADAAQNGPASQPLIGSASQPLTPSRTGDGAVVYPSGAKRTPPRLET